MPEPNPIIGRLREAAVCVALVALAFFQSPERIVADSRTALAVDPGRLLSGTLHLWDPDVGFGRVHEAYGYLWPSGPFFAVGTGIGLSHWAVQRLWWALLLCLAFTGAVRVAERLGVGTPTSRLVAGASFALSPAVLTEIGTRSLEAWPLAVAPWVLLPLIAHSSAMGARRAVAASALAVACAGGIGLTAIAAVPLAFLWLLQRGRVRVLVAWCAAVVAATLWWWVPLLLARRYGWAPASPESQVVDVTAVAEPPSRIVTVATVVVAALGVAGLARPGMPHRRFAVTALVAGFAVTALGHGSDLPWTPRLDIDVAPAFDVMLLLPLALGLAHLLGLPARMAAVHPRLEYAPVAATAGAIVAVLLAATPALARQVAPDGGFREIPDYWRAAAAWLDENTEARVLVVPSAGPEYVWGTTTEEIAGLALAGRWAARSVSGPAGPVLDAVEAVLATGYGSTGLADVLARSGVTHVLVRNDLVPGRATRPLMVRQALHRSGGLSLVATFGPEVGNPVDAGSLADHGMSGPVPALEVYRVDREVHPVVAHRAASAATVVGGAGSLLRLAEAGLLPPMALASDHVRTVGTGWDAMASRPVLVTDTSALVGYRGIRTVRASSAGEQHDPFAALDGDPATSWRPAAAPAGQWLEVSFAEARPVPRVELTIGSPAGAPPTRLLIDAGGQRTGVDVPGGTVGVDLPSASPIRSIRLTVARAVDGFGIAELTVPGLTPRRTLIVPAVPAPTPAIVLTAAPSTPACLFADDGIPRCAAGIARPSADGMTIDRTLTLAAAADFVASIWSRPRAGAALGDLLDATLTGAPTVSASSVAVDEPAARPGAVVDGDPATAWWPSTSDTTPSLRFVWPAPREITGIRLSVAEGTAATAIAGITVVADGAHIAGSLHDGVLMFDAPLRTSTLSLFPHEAGPSTTDDPYADRREPLPIAVGEVTFLPDPPRPRPDQGAPVPLACGSGPALRIGDHQLTTRLVATVADLVQRREVPAAVCGPATVAVASGEVDLLASASTLATPTRVVLLPPSSVPAPDGRATVPVHQWSVTERRLVVPPHAGDLVLAVRENTNPGWRARIGDTALAPVVVDGWQQGWLVPAGLSGEVVLRYAPDTAYRAGLLTGAGLLLVLVALAVVRQRAAAPPGRQHGATGRLTPLVIGGAGLIAAAGVAGAVLVGAGIATAAAGRRGRLPRALQTLAPPVLLLAAGGLGLTGERPDVWAQVAGLLAIAALWWSVSLPAARASR